MADNELEALRDAILTWQTNRVPLAGPFTQDGLRAFSEAMNFHTRKLIRAFDTNDPDFFSALMELASHAQTMVTGAKLIANKVDRTNT